MKKKWDYIIIGSGAGGGTLAQALTEKGKEVLLLERGGYLPREKENWDPSALFESNRYGTQEKWLDAHGKPFTPSTHYFVGGNTKFYGAALLRLRESDFGEVAHFGGISPAWPLSYADFAPYYQRAEELYHIRGNRGEDPTEPPSSAPYPYPAIAHEPQIAKIASLLEKEGLHPFHLPLGVRFDPQKRESSLCIGCDTCDGFPCLVDAKSDSHHMCIVPALQKGLILYTHTKALRLLPNATKDRIVGVEVEREGKRETLEANTYIVSCGAINSAALLLRSQVANSSGLVGRHYMCHLNSAIIALSREKNRIQFQKTLALNDFYHQAPDSPYPLGHIQLLGKVQGAMLSGDAPFWTPKWVLDKMAEHAIGWWITSEDLPDPNNRVFVDSAGTIHLQVEQKNGEAHRRLLQKLEEILKKSSRYLHHFPSQGYLSKKIPLAGVAHQVGTLCFGKDPKTSVLDTSCKTHDVDNLYVVDGSFFPSSGAVNPALTIIANALRVADVLGSV